MCAVFGDLDSASGRTVRQICPRKYGEAFVAFLDQLVAAFPDGPVVVVLGNVGDRKGQVAERWWLAHHERVRPRWLPAYAPRLNPLERVWGHRKDTLGGHRWWADLPALESAAGRLLSHLRARFHQPDPGGIALTRNFCEPA